MPKKSKHVKSSASASVNQRASANSDKNSASVNYKNTIEAEAGVSVSDKYASVGASASAKTGTEASASGGLDGNNAYLEASYSDTTEAHITVDGAVNYEGLGVSVSGDAYAKSGNEALASVEAGQNGLSMAANVSSGSCVGVDGEGTVNLREASATAGAGVSVGEHFEAGGSGEATFKKGKATIGVSGDLAAVVGLEVDVSVTVDTHQIQKDTMNGIAAGTKATKDTGKAIKKIFHF